MSCCQFNTLKPATKNRQDWSFSASHCCTSPPTSFLSIGGSPLLDILGIATREIIVIGETTGKIVSLQCRRRVIGTVTILWILFLEGVSWNTSIVLSLISKLLQYLLGHSVDLGILLVANDTQGWRVPDQVCHQASLRIVKAASVLWDEGRNAHLSNRCLNGYGPPEQLVRQLWD